jgi:hypothetical protein
LRKAIGATGATTFDLSNAWMLSGVMVLNNWIRQGIVERGLVVSGGYISRLGRNAADHVRSIMSREMASLTLGEPGPRLCWNGHPTECGNQHRRLHDRGRSQPTVPGYPMDAHPPPDVHPVVGDPQGGDRQAPLLLQEVLDSVGIDISDIDQVITHQTSARAIKKGMAEISEAFGGKPRHEGARSLIRQPSAPRAGVRGTAQAQLGVPVERITRAPIVTTLRHLLRGPRRHVVAYLVPHRVRQATPLPHRPHDHPDPSPLQPHPPRHPSRRRFQHLACLSSAAARHCWARAIWIGSGDVADGGSDRTDR